MNIFGERCWRHVAVCAHALGHGVVWLLLGESLLVPGLAFAGRDDPATAESAKDATKALVVEVEPSVADAEDFPGWLMRRHPELGGRLPEVPGHEQWILVKVGGTTYDYRVTVTAMRDGVAIGSGGVEFPCECVNRMLFERVDAEIDRAVEELQAVAAEEAKTGEARGTTQSEHAQQQQDVRPNDGGGPSRRLGQLGYAGLGLGLLGGAALVGGAILATREPREYRYVADAMSRQVRTTQVPGWVLVAGGGVTFVSGAAMLITDMVKRRRVRPVPALRLNVYLTGIALAGRF